MEDNELEKEVGGQEDIGSSDSGKRVYRDSERYNLAGSISNKMYGVSDDELEEMERKLMMGESLDDEDDEEEEGEEDDKGKKEQDENIGSDDDPEDREDDKKEEEVETLSSFLNKSKETQTDEDKAKLDKEAELSRKAAELEAREQALLDMRELILNNGKQQAQSVGANEEDSFKAFSKDLIEGEDEKAADKLKDGVDRLLKSRVAPVESKLEEFDRDFDRKVEMVARRIDLERRWETTLSDFAETRKDIAEDKFLAGLFNQNLRMAADAGLAPERAVKLAAAEIDTWLNSRFGKQAEVQKSERSKKISERQETLKKATLKPSGISKTEAKPDPDYEQETPSQIIERMRRERGL